MRIRELTRAHGEALVTAGTLYMEDMPPLPAVDETHCVPSHYWMMITAGGTTECYLLPQQAPRDSDPAQYALDEQTLRGHVRCLP